MCVNENLEHRPDVFVWGFIGHEVVQHSSRCTRQTWAVCLLAVHLTPTVLGKAMPVCERPIQRESVCSMMPSRFLVVFCDFGNVLFYVKRTAMWAYPAAGTWSFTLEVVSQQLMSWLDTVAWRNIPDMFFTLDVFMQKTFFLKKKDPLRI